MNEETLTPDLQLVDLGDAKELTMGIPDIVFAEEDPTVQGRLVP